MNVKKGIIAILIITVISIAVAYYLLGIQKETSSNNASLGPPIYAGNIIDSQKNILQAYSDVNWNSDDRLAVFADLMAPFGVFDPISTVNKEVPIKELINFLYGNYANKLGISETQAMELIKIRISTGTRIFDYKTDFVARKELYENLSGTLQSDSSLQYSSFWPSGIYRVNNYFGDKKREMAWEVSLNDAGFYIPGSLDVYESNAAKFRERAAFMSHHNDILEQMMYLNIQTMYNCEGKTIFILDGIANNAYGYIHHASSSEEVNCGMLAQRFRIIKDEALEENWRYWAAN